MIRLLIADDERLEREALVEMVSRRFEHEVVLETAENGRKAADAAILWGADLILMDIEMPGMSGLDAARAVTRLLQGTDFFFLADGRQLGERLLGQKTGDHLYLFRRA